LSSQVIYDPVSGICIQHVWEDWPPALAWCLEDNFVNPCSRCTHPWPSDSEGHDPSAPILYCCTYIAAKLSQCQSGCFIGIGYYCWTSYCII